MQTLLELAAALAVAHTLHAFIETNNVRMKLQRAIDAKDGKALKPYPIQIDTRTKAYGLGVLATVLLTAVAYGVLTLLAIPAEVLVWMVIILLVTVELYNLVALDKYHIAIQPVIDFLDKKKS